MTITFPISPLDELRGYAFPDPDAGGAAGSGGAGKTLRVVTYNIHKGIGGVDRRYRLERVIEVLRGCAGDLVFLQEVDEGVPRSRRERQVDVIGDALGLPHRAWGPNVALRKGCYGNALLSRFRLDHSENLDLTIPPKKRRGVLHTRLTLEQDGERYRLWLFNAHLGLSGLERRAQLRMLLRYLSRHPVPRRAGIVLGGDFNDVFGRLGPAVLRGAGFRTLPTRVATFPAFRPVRLLDRLFVRGPVTVESLSCSRSRLARQASDHLPMTAVLRLAAPEEG